MNRVVYCLFFSLLKVTLPSVIFNPEVQEQLYEFNISFTLNNNLAKCSFVVFVLLCKGVHSISFFNRIWIYPTTIWVPRPLEQYVWPCVTTLLFSV